MSRQRLGQHFLQSAPILERIAKAACGERAGTVIEIGPGRGALTERLLPRVDRLVAIELDPEMVLLLEARFASEDKITIVPGDALEQDLQHWKPDVICGNLPYYAATPILEKVVRYHVPAVALIQKEVAERITAGPGSREYGFLTCSLRLHADANYLFGVKPGAFRPPPKVDSAVVRLEPNARLAELQIEEQVLLRFLSACFQHKRKTLRNNLAGRYPLSLLDQQSESTQRAEQCSLEELAGLYRKLEGDSG